MANLMNQVARRASVAARPQHFNYTETNAAAFDEARRKRAQAANSEARRERQEDKNNDGSKKRKGRDDRRSSIISVNSETSGGNERDDLEELPHYKSVASEKDISAVIAEKFSANYDAKIRKWNLFNLGIAVLSVALMMLEIWFAFDRERCFEHLPAGWDPNDADYTPKNCLFQSTTTYMHKIAISILTVILMISVTLYYRFQIKTERNASWFIADSVIWREHTPWFWLLEMIVILPHTFPTGEFLSLYDDKLGTLMFVRSYLLIRVFRDWSPIYRRRLELLADSFVKRSGAVEFNWLLSLKFMFLQHMWAFVILTTVFVWFLMAYVIWVFERETVRAFKLEISVWMTCITMSTVGFGDVSPKDGVAQILTAWAAVFGIILAALLVFAVLDSLTLSPQDTRVKNLWTRKRTIDRQRVAAARYIQLMYANYKIRARVELIGETDEYHDHMREFNSRNAYFKAILRSCRRDLSMSMELDDLVIDRLEEKMDSMSGSISNRLAYRLGLRPSRRSSGGVSIKDLRDRVELLEDEQNLVLQKTEQILKVLIASNSSVFGNFFS